VVFANTSIRYLVTPIQVAFTINTVRFSEGAVLIVDIFDHAGIGIYTDPIVVVPANQTVNVKADLPIGTQLGTYNVTISANSKFSQCIIIRHYYVSLFCFKQINHVHGCLIIRI